MNPMLGSLAMMGYAQPELFSQVMAAQGISPNALNGQPGAPGIVTGDPMAALMSPQAAAPAAPAPAPAANPMLSGLQGVKPPQAQAPVMNAGVSGSQKAPEVSGGAQSASMGPILQLLLRQQQGPAASVPDLGSLMRGV